jgi:hypothetical protein
VAVLWARLVRDEPSNRPLSINREKFMAKEKELCKEVSFG